MKKDKNKFKPVEGRVSFPKLEEDILAFWKKNKTFEASIENRKDGKPWTFLDGPPFITGLPHYGSLLSSIPKDVFPRFWTMKGRKVRRVWGWDCHGLPAENKVENKLKIKRKKDIEEMVGVKKFIDECKSYVGQVSGEWEWYVDHVGRWVDFKNAYKTMDTSYMESVMWVFKSMYDKGYIYKGLRVSLFCPHCSTPISNFEVAMDADNYKEISEPSNVYKYKLKDVENTYILAWSTTPWNKIVTPALAVNPDLTYVKVKQADEYYILAKSTLEILTGEHTVEETYKGSDLVGRKFEPHYDFYEIEEGKRAFVVIPGDFVTAEEGTGVVTIAAYGEDDLAVMKKENIQIVLHVDEEGNLKDDVPKWAGMYYLEVNPLVNEDLASRGLMYREDAITHNVATCWRCHTRLIYAPQDAWYVDVQKLKKRLKDTNKDVNWFPKHFKEGRYLRSVEAAPDWCISRSRYWGSPVPVWETEDGERIVPGSIAELEKLSGKKVEDLHKPEIDDLVLTSPKTGKKAYRVPEVLDSWIEAGSAPFAERHFPFEGVAVPDEFFPPDFIVEYTGQIRAWFYVLHVIGAALYDTHSFHNVVVTGVVLGTDGRKMSKNFGNYPDPKEMLEKYGGDALRLYLMGSPVMHGEDIALSEDEYAQYVRGFLMTYWNIYKFFVTYANTCQSWEVPQEVDYGFAPDNVLDKWILSKTYRSIDAIEKNGFHKFDTVEVVNVAKTFIIRDLSSWYVRRIRNRVGPSADDGQDKHDALTTLWMVLVDFSKALAPLVPFVTEAIYQNLTGRESVHLEDWIDQHGKDAYVDDELEHQMDPAIRLTSKIHAFRRDQQIKVKVPVKYIKYAGPGELDASVRQIVQEETNVYELEFVKKTEDYHLVEPDTSESNLDLDAGDARTLIRKVQNLRKTKGCTIDEQISVVLPAEYKRLDTSLIETIKKQTLAKAITWGDKIDISTG